MIISTSPLPFRFRHALRPVALLACLALATLGLAARFSIEHSYKLVRLADPQISPDGKRVVLVVSRANFEENRYDAELVEVDIATRAQRVLTHGRTRVSSPRWSPDGRRLAFLSPVDAKPQVFVMPLEGGDAWQVTKAPEGVQQFVWRPGGREIAYVATDEPPKATGEERHNRAFEAQHNHYLMQTTPRPAHLWLAPAAGGTARRLTSGEWSLPQVLPPSSPSSPPSFSPDGKQVALVKLETPFTGDADRSTIQVLDIESGRMRALTGRTRNEIQPLFSPDGQWVAHWWPRDGQSRNVNEIHLGSAAGGESRSITRPLDRNVQRSIWLPDGRSLLVSANDGAGVGLWVQPVDGPARRVKMGAVVATTGFWLDASVGPKGEIVLTGAEPESALELYYLATPESEPRKLTQFNQTQPGVEVGRTEAMEWDGPDGFRQNGVITYPPGYQKGRRYPLVLYIHGGPRSASKAVFAARAKALASQDWIVFEPNYRGSDNLGNAFQAAIWNDAGAGPGRDVMSGVAELVKRGIVDEARMAVSGWSYGGYMTVWLLGNYPDKWKAAMAGAAVTDIEDQYNLGDANVRRGSTIGGSPWTDAKRPPSLRRAIPDYLRAAHQSSDADHGAHRGLPRHHNAVVSALSCVARQRGARAIHPVSAARALAHRSRAPARCRPPMDRVAGEAPQWRRGGVGVAPNCVHPPVGGTHLLPWSSTCTRAVCGIPTSRALRLYSPTSSTTTTARPVSTSTISRTRKATPKPRVKSISPRIAALESSPLSVNRTALLLRSICSRSPPP